MRGTKSDKSDTADAGGYCGECGFTRRDIRHERRCGACAKSGAKSGSPGRTGDVGESKGDAPTQLCQVARDQEEQAEWDLHTEANTAHLKDPPPTSSTSSASSISSISFVSASSSSITFDAMSAHILSAAMALADSYAETWKRIAAARDAAQRAVGSWSQRSREIVAGGTLVALLGPAAKRLSARRTLGRSLDACVDVCVGDPAALCHSLCEALDSARKYDGRTPHDAGFLCFATARVCAAIARAPFFQTPARGGFPVSKTEDTEDAEEADLRAGLAALFGRLVGGSPPCRGLGHGVVAVMRLLPPRDAADIIRRVVLGTGFTDFEGNAPTNRRHCFLAIRAAYLHTATTSSAMDRVLFTTCHEAARHKSSTSTSTGAPGAPGGRTPKVNDQQGHGHGQDRALLDAIAGPVILDVLQAAAEAATAEQLDTCLRGLSKTVREEDLPPLGPYRMTTDAAVGTGPQRKSTPDKAVTMKVGDIVEGTSTSTRRLVTGTREGGKCVCVLCCVCAWLGGGAESEWGVHGCQVVLLGKGMG
jgi:hypothetical protein